MFILTIAVVSVLVIYGVYLWWLRAHEKVEDEEFKKIKGVWSREKEGSIYLSPCPICARVMCLENTQKVMYINGLPEVCCISHTAREMTDYIKSKERGKKIETTNN